VEKLEKNEKNIKVWLVALDSETSDGKPLTLADHVNSELEIKGNENILCVWHNGSALKRIHEPHELLECTLIVNERQPHRDGSMCADKKLSVFKRILKQFRDFVEVSDD
jgi:hypothetical protein